MPFCDLANVRLFYEMEGAPGRPVLILSNSLGTDLSMWDAQMDSFSRAFQVLRYDSRGQGRSSVPPGPYTIQAMGEDVLELADALKVDRFHFCGLSMGGMVGQWLGVHAPQRLRRLVLSNTAARIGTAESWDARIDLATREGMKAVTPMVVARWYTERFRAERLDEVERSAAMLDASPTSGYVASCAAIRDMDQRNAVRTISVPTLVVFGTEDEVTPPAAAYELSESIAHARLLKLSAAHLANIEQAAEFNKGVLEFLESPLPEGSGHGR